MKRKIIYIILSLALISCGFVGCDDDFWTDDIQYTEDTVDAEAEISGEDTIDSDASKKTFGENESDDADEGNSDASKKTIGENESDDADEGNSDASKKTIGENESDDADEGNSDTSKKTIGEYAGIKEDLKEANKENLSEDAADGDTSEKDAANKDTSEKDATNKDTAEKDAADNDTTDKDTYPVGEGPNISFDTVDVYGNSFNSDIIKNAKVVMLNLWEPWCGPCVNEMPELSQLYEDYNDKGLLIIGAYTTFEMDEDAIDIVKKLNITYPVIKCNKSINKLEQDYVPATFLIDHNGNVITLEPFAGSNSYKGWEEVILPYLED